MTAETSQSFPLQEGYEFIKCGSPYQVEVVHLENLTDADRRQVNQLLQEFPGAEQEQDSIGKLQDGLNTRIPLLYLARNNEGDIVGIVTANLLKGFKSCQENQRHGTIHIGNAIVHPEYRNMRIMTTLAHIVLSRGAIDMYINASAIDESQLVGDEIPNLSEGVTKQVILDHLQRAYFYLETTLITGRYPQSGSELLRVAEVRRTFVREAAKRGWKLNSETVRQVTRAAFAEGYISLEPGKDGTWLLSVESNVREQIPGYEVSMTSRDFQADRIAQRYNILPDQYQPLTPDEMQAAGLGGSLTVTAGIIILNLFRVTCGTRDEAIALKEQLEAVVEEAGIRFEAKEGDESYITGEGVREQVLAMYIAAEEFVSTQGLAVTYHPEPIQVRTVFS